MQNKFGFYIKAVYLLIFLLMIPVITKAQSGMYYTDITHYSKTFGHDKTFRMYIPGGYETSGKNYPVIYFFHGWGGRYYKDDNALLEYDSLKQVVDRHQVILVMWDGNVEEANPRPYNIGNHKDIIYPVQMKDYFLELVDYIDSNYRTISDRNHRGIIGFSMGGIMSFFLAGMYPDRVGAAVNFAGTPEFFIGYPDNHTLYPVRYTFSNLKEVYTRQYSGNTDILTFLNEEVRKGAQWEGNPYEFIPFKGGHMIDKPGQTAVFESAVDFLCSHFGNMRLNPPARWSHYDLYGHFTIWNYEVTSNKKTPGYLFLRNAGFHGFGLYTHKWLPDGPAIPEVLTSVITAPLYVPGKTYQLISLDAGNFKKDIVLKEITADEAGRITVNDIQGNTEYGIFQSADMPDFIVCGYQLNDDHRYLIPGKNTVQFRILNRGGELNADSVKVFVNCRDSAVVIKHPGYVLHTDRSNRVYLTQPFEIDNKKEFPEHGEPFQVRLQVNIGDTVNEVIIPVLFDAPEFSGIEIDDGRVVGDSAMGIGNANGIAEPGEKIMLYHSGHRLRLYTNDPYVVQSEEVLHDEQLPSVWEDSFTLSSVISISKACPAEHVIECIASYETVTFNPIERKVHWGKVRINCR